MTITAQTPWPNNYAEEAVYIQQYLERLRRVQKIKLGHVVIRSFVRPSRNQWEAAWIDQTAFRLPIPPGAKLCWFDLRSGRMRTYMTVNDLDDGARSSGEMYEIFDTTEPLTAWHFLGVQQPLSWLMNTHEQCGQYVSVNINPVDQAKDKLMAWMLIFKLRFSKDRAFAIRMQAYDEGLNSIMQEPSKILAGEAYAEVMFGDQGTAAPTLTLNSLTDPSSAGELNLMIDGSKVPNDVSGHNTLMWAEGVIYMFNVVPQYVDAYQRGSLFGVGTNAYYQMSAWATTFADGNHRLVNGALARYDRAEFRVAPIFHPALATTTGAISQGPVDLLLGSPAQEISRGSKIWMYGMYGKNINNVMEYD